MNITKGTILRAVVLAVVLINMILKSCGKNIIPVDEASIAYWIETVLEIAIVVVGFWKNNSFSKKAIEADKYLNKLKSESFDENENNS